jgi:hypothetical protein
LNRANQIIRSVHQLEKIHAVIEAAPVGHGNKCFQGRIACAGAHARQRPVDAGCAMLDSD